MNGRPVSELYFDGTEPNAAKTVALSRWRGVDLVAGDNRLVATVVDAAGDEIAVLERIVRYGGGGVRAELVAEESQLTADGRTQPVDRAARLRRVGRARATRHARRLSRRSAVSHVVGSRDAARQSAARRKPPRADVRRRGGRPRAHPARADRANRHGRRAAALQRAPGAGDPRVARARAARLDPGRHRRKHGRLQRRSRRALEPPDVEDGYSSDGRLAFFAKGRIKGSTLLTIAFDSERDRPLVEDRLFGTIEPDRYYTLYGDAVEQRFEAVDDAQAVSEDRAAPVRGAVRRLRDRASRHGAQPLQPHPHGLQGRLRRRRLRASTRSRPRTASVTAATSSWATARRDRISCRARRSSRTAIGCASRSATACAARSSSSRAS